MTKSLKTIAILLLKLVVASGWFAIVILSIFSAPPVFILKDTW